MSWSIVGPVKRSAERMLTTHVGSLPRPKELLDLMRNMLNGLGDETEYADGVRDAVTRSVRQQVEHGLDLVSDGEQGKIGFFRYSGLPKDECRQQGELYVAAVNRALQDIAPERVRYHTCYGINEGPRVHDAPLADLIDLVLKVNAGAYSFEAANARHEHEYHIWERVGLPSEKLLVPGVITHGCSIVEHPELIAERLVRFGRIVGRENVIASADCGFSSQATFNPELHPKIMWAKFDAMAEGARLASQT